ncbi:hypothetical protein [Kutzneria albida]|uniref:Uncharacterized protein n=1 Tax=Kutzneria albida DSM 43870 TaxID=1449976 RepID=W5WBQ8_9PSEU|nr:hypothetical protein [Kutzneria albida]AHH98608.1 hypothetical protein KALB_5246 [Kutzneria albida DSM 43870]
MSVPVFVEDVLDTRPLDATGLTIGGLLAANRLPESLFQPYLVRGATATPVPLTARLADLPPDADRLLVRAIRNTLFPTVLPAAADATDTRYSDVGVGFRAIRADAGGKAYEARVTVGLDQARVLVSDEVTAFTREHAVSEAGCVFGISGGGDSNALAYGLANAVPNERLLAFTLVFGAVFSPEAAIRAGVLCQELGIEHRVLNPADIADLLGIRTSLDALYADFSAMFTNEALHFFGTFLILRTARRLAAIRGFSDLAFGYNREDLLAEALFMVMNGNRPLQYPVRQLGAHRVIMPVWRVPKLLLDACHPRFSLENYRERDPYTTRQRSLAFFLAHTMDSAYPSFGLSLLTGMKESFAGAWGTVSHVDDLDVFVTEQASTENVERVRDLLGRHFTDEN